jgi:hypothetical protein
MGSLLLLHTEKKKKKKERVNIACRLLLLKKLGIVERRKDRMKHSFIYTLRYAYRIEIYVSGEEKEKVVDCVYMEEERYYKRTLIGGYL